MSSSKITYPPIKIVFVGDSTVGKTSLVERLVRDRFSENTNSTIGAAFVSTRYPEQNSRIYHIWDTAGQERFNALIPLYVSGASVIVMVYDITKSQSYERIEQHWMPYIRENLRLDDHEAMPMILLLGNKNDLEANRRVSTEKAKSLAKQHKMGFQEISAKTGSGSTNVFQLIAQYADNLVLTQADALRLNGDEESQPQNNCNGFRCY